MMDSGIGSEHRQLTTTTSGFVLAAAVVGLFSTTIACVKDAYSPLKAFLKSMAGHDWTTQGLIDLLLFIGLGLIFANTGITQRMDADRLIAALIGAVVIAGLGLVLWFAFY